MVSFAQIRGASGVAWGPDRPLSRKPDVHRENREQSVKKVIADRI